MKATTHTEVYRRFQGELRPTRWLFRPIAASGVRIALKSKWPLLLFVPTLITTVIFSFVVYAKFALEQGMTPGALAGSNAQASAGVAMVGAMASKMIEVRDTIVSSSFVLGFFSVLLLAWYGAGLVCEDRRVGAHLLYFSRPLSRLEYAIGKLLTVGTFVFASVLIPGVVITFFAIFSSPEWSFLKDQWPVILHVLAGSLVHTIALSSVVLAISSLASRRLYALIATVGFFVLTQVVGMLLAQLQHDARWMAIGPLANVRRVTAAIFGVERIPGFRLGWPTELSAWVLVGYVVVAWIVLLRRVKAMEVVA